MKDEHEKFEARLSAVEDAIRGSVDGQPGILQSLLRLMRDMYETDDSVISTIKRWDREKAKWAGYVGGAVFVATTAANAVIFWLEHKK